MDIEKDVALRSEYTASIIDFGAISGGTGSNTRAIRQAVEDCAKHGGGKVIVPKGTWLTGAVHLQSNIELHLEEGAKLLFSPNREEYLPVVYTFFEGVRCYNYSPLIYGRGLKNVAVTGNGTLDGNGSCWWDWKQNETGVTALYTAGAEGIPVEKRVYGTEAAGLRPCLLQLVECENVRIEGLTVCNSPFWNIHPVCCKNVVIRGLTLNNPYESPNTDSINMECCSEVLVEHCHILGGGDDCFTIKSGRGREGWEIGQPCENIVIRYCSAQNVRGGGIVIGSEMSGGVQNVLAHDCRFDRIGSGVKIKSKKGRGGFVKNVRYQNLQLGRVQYAINITLKYPYPDIVSRENPDALPEISDVSCSDFNCDYAQCGIQLEGLEDDVVQNISIRNVNIKESDCGFILDNVENLKLQNIRTGQR